MFIQATFMLLEPAINEILAFDPHASAKIKKLENRKLVVSLTDLNLNVALLVANGKICLMTNAEHADCMVTTDLNNLKSLSDASVLTKLIKQDDLELEGDLAIAQGFSALLVDNNIDWQEWLSRYVGDAMSYRIAKTIENLSIWLKRKIADAEYTASTALTEELRVTPDSTEVASFVESVDELAMRTENLLYKLTRLKEQATNV